MDEIARYIAVAKWDEDKVCAYCATIEEIAKLVGADRSDIHWSLKRCGRWDSEDRKWVVIDQHQEEI